MNFSNVKEWTIAEGSVLKATDSLGIVIWEKEQPVSNGYFYVEDASGQDNTLIIKKNNREAPAITVYKSSDGTNWESMGSTSTIDITATIPANGKLYLKATADKWATNAQYYNTIKASGSHNIGGNIMSLLYGDNFENQTSFPSGSTFNLSRLFYDNTTLVSAADLIMSATTLTTSCYGNMFRECTSLTTAPVLFATTLADNCYQTMFYNCTSLTKAPALSATSLNSYCYYGMFQYCTSLTKAPALPATTLNDFCYGYMFNGCTSLTQAPVLRATTLVNYCYSSMFQGCSNLNSVTTYAQDISATDCLNYWLNNTAATGDFYNLGGATYPSGASGIPSGWTEHTSL